MQRVAGGYTILHYSLFRWSLTLARGDVSSTYDSPLGSEYYRELKEWELLIRDILRACADIHAISPLGETPFLVLLSNVRIRLHTYSSVNPIHKSRRSLKKVMAAWLRILREEGFYLQAYKEREIQLWDTQLLKSWGGISRIEIMPHDWVDIHWGTPEERPEVQERLFHSLDYFSVLTGDKAGEDKPPQDGSNWYMVSGKYMTEGKYNEDNGLLKMPGSWV
jgi:hypothetical protein